MTLARPSFPRCLRELAHRQVMRLLAMTGQRGAALAQYETCRQILTEELDVKPSLPPPALYERIRDEETVEGHRLKVESSASDDVTFNLPTF